MKHRLTFAVLIIMSPELSDLLLTADIPNSEANSFRDVDFFNIESYCRNCADRLVQLYFVEDGSFPWKRMMNTF
jgi:hypothetical protein